jgi:hypothetical protein
VASLVLLGGVVRPPDPRPPEQVALGLEVEARSDELDVAFGVDDLDDRLLRQVTPPRSPGSRSIPRISGRGAP